MGNALSFCFSEPNFFQHVHFSFLEQNINTSLYKNLIKTLEGRVKTGSEWKQRQWRIREAGLETASK